MSKLLTSEHTQWSWVMPVCEECGAVLADQRQHDEWHARIAVRLAELVARLGGVNG